MILPLKDILSTEKQKSFRFGHQGLVIIVKGHEELFFEFATEERRDAFISVIHRQLEDVRKRTGSSDMRKPPVAGTRPSSSRNSVPGILSI